MSETVPRSFTTQALRCRCGSLLLVSAGAVYCRASFRPVGLCLLAPTGGYLAPLECMVLHVQVEAEPGEASSTSQPSVVPDPDDPTSTLEEPFHPEPDCPTCQDTGVVRGEDGQDRPCGCRREGVLRG